MCTHKGLNFWIHSIDPNNPIAKVNHKANYESKSNNLLIVSKTGQVFFFFLNTCGFVYILICLISEDLILVLSWTKFTLI